MAQYNCEHPPRLFLQLLREQTQGGGFAAFPETDQCRRQQTLCQETRKTRTFFRNRQRHRATAFRSQGGLCPPSSTVARPRSSHPHRTCERRTLKGQRLSICDTTTTVINYQAFRSRICLLPVRRSALPTLVSRGIR